MLHAVKDFASDLDRCEGDVAAAVRVIFAAAAEAGRTRQARISQVPLPLYPHCPVSPLTLSLVPSIPLPPILPPPSPPSHSFLSPLYSPSHFKSRPGYSVY